MDAHLHRAAYDGNARDIASLVAAGADVESLDLDETPLWTAVCRGHRDVAEALLKAGADPWRPVLGGRSAGAIALTGPLGDLFRKLPGCPEQSPDQARRQAEADALIDRYAQWNTYCGEMDGFAFIAGLDEDSAIRRLGLDPADCPVVGRNDYQEQATTNPGGELWLGRPPGAEGVAVYSAISFDPGSSHLWGPLSSHGPVVSTATNMIVDSYIEIWRDGAMERIFQSLQEPGDDTSEEEWLCRFYDHSTHRRGLASCLALGSLVTGVEVDEAWLFEARKRLVIPQKP
ncbi:ankyrin repeat domain-containing protein [Herbidospora sp. RD11066]